MTTPEDNHDLDETNISASGAERDDRLYCVLSTSATHNLLTYTRTSSWTPSTDTTPRTIVCSLCSPYPCSRLLSLFHPHFVLMRLMPVLVCTRYRMLHMMPTATTGQTHHPGNFRTYISLLYTVSHAR
jgi:hypothetical protein